MSLVLYYNAKIRHKLHLEPNNYDDEGWLELVQTIDLIEYEEDKK